MDLMSYSRMDDRVEINEAFADSLQSMEALVLTLGNQSSSSSSSSQLDRCTAMADNTVKKFKKFIGALDRVGHARFRRAPLQSQAMAESSPSPAASPPPMPTPPPPNFPHMSLTLDFTKPTPVAPPAGKIAGNGKFIDENFSISPPISGNSSFLSSITADGSVSNGRGTSSLFLSRTASGGRPPLLSAAKKKCHGSSASGCRCHCSKKK